MKRTDKPQPRSSQAKEDRIRKVGLFWRIKTALQQAFHKVFPPTFYIALDMTLPLVLIPVIFRYVKTNLHVGVKGFF